MKKLNLYISESLVTAKPIGELKKYKYHPNGKYELTRAIKNELREGNYDLNCIDTSKVTDMSHLFDFEFNGININNINIDVSEWNVSNVKNMLYMFYNCKKFNCDLSNWDVSNVENMCEMFFNCKKFEGKGLETWDVNNVTDMGWMFWNCEKFDCDLSKWNVSNVTDMSSMFNECKNFHGKGLENWNVSNLLYVAQMLTNAPAEDSFIVDERGIIKIENNKFVKK